MFHAEFFRVQTDNATTIRMMDFKGIDFMGVTDEQVMRVHEILNLGAEEEIRLYDQKI